MARSRRHYFYRCLRILLAGSQFRKTRMTRNEPTLQINSIIGYPPIKAHGVIGDRRTGALVAADGTIDWLCLPDYNCGIVFGAALDCFKGGHWKLGPALKLLGNQGYINNTPLLRTRWSLPEGEIELIDLMPWPDRERSPENRDRRVIIRKLRCLSGKAECIFEFVPRLDFKNTFETTNVSVDGISLKARGLSLHLWINRPVQAHSAGASQRFWLHQGEELWAVLESSAQPKRWDCDSAQALWQETICYWEDWIHKLAYTGPRRKQVERSAMLVHLLSYAPTGSLVASITTSLPERIGGHWTADYRLAWVRDASLSLGMLARLGNLEDAQHYFNWLIGLNSSTDSPLQVVYGIHGETNLEATEIPEIEGYRGTLPVRLGNNAYKQRQLDSMGYLVDCAWHYLEHGGQWKPEYSILVCRAAEYTASHWQLPDNGIWELAEQGCYVSSRIMSWVLFDRALRIAQRVPLTADLERWRRLEREIYRQVFERGWSDTLGAFRQRYEGENLDAANLLISIMGFLPGDDPRVLSNIQRTAEYLSINGFVYRFLPSATPGMHDRPLGELEGAFFPCTFWLATAYAKAGQIDKAEQIIDAADQSCGPLGLFAEGIDARNGDFLGNTPLMFSQVEYLRAMLEIVNAKPFQKMRLIPGQIQQKLHAVGS
jgi:GH15 family glucan-1,4-alpha-glucosidase